MTEEKIINVASRLFDAKLDSDSKIGDVASWDSLGQLNLFMALEAEFSVKFTSTEILESVSINKIVKLITTKL